MILFISDSRESIPIVYRLRKEGIDAQIYVHDAGYRHNYEGILSRLSLAGLKPALRKAETVCIDITLLNHKKPHDLALLSAFGIKSNVPGIFGPLSDKLRRDHYVIGGSSWCEHIEMDREAGYKLAKNIGLNVPNYQHFKGLKQGIGFLQGSEGKKEKWVFKLLNMGPLDLTYPEESDGELLDFMQTSLPRRLEKEHINPEQAEYILQSFVPGTEVSSELWWDGTEFLNPNRTIEEKPLGDDNTGPSTGSQSNSVWRCKDMDGPVFKEMQKLAPYLKVAGYAGCIDANCIIGEDGKPWFLEWTPRFGYSALYCFLSFIPPGQLSNFILNGFQAVFKDGFVASQLLSLWPYPDPDKAKLAQNIKDNLIFHRLQDLDYMWLQDIWQAEDKKLRVGGEDGYIGVITAHADDMEGAIKKCHQKVNKFEAAGNLQYRTEYDHLTRHVKRYKELEKAGVV